MLYTAELLSGWSQRPSNGRHPASTQLRAIAHPCIAERQKVTPVKSHKHHCSALVCVILRFKHAGEATAVFRSDVILWSSQNLHRCDLQFNFRWGHEQSNITFRFFTYLFLLQLLGTCLMLSTHPEMQAMNGWNIAEEGYLKRTL